MRVLCLLTARHVELCGIYMYVYIECMHLWGGGGALMYFDIDMTI